MIENNKQSLTVNKYLERYSIESERLVNNIIYSKS